MTPLKISIAQAKDQLPRIVRNAEEGIPIVLTRRGKTVAALVSIRDFRAAGHPPEGFWEAWQAFVRTTNVDALGFTDEDFANLRDRTPGRKIHL